MIITLGEVQELKREIPEHLDLYDLLDLCEKFLECVKHHETVGYQYATPGEIKQIAVLGETMIRRILALIAEFKGMDERFMRDIAYNLTATLSGYYQIEVGGKINRPSFFIKFVGDQKELNFVEFIAKLEGVVYAVIYLTIKKEYEEIFSKKVFVNRVVIGMINSLKLHLAPEQKLSLEELEPEEGKEKKKKEKKKEK